MCQGSGAVGRVDNVRKLAVSQKDMLQVELGIVNLCITVIIYPASKRIICVREAQHSVPFWPGIPHTS